MLGSGREGSRQIKGEPKMVTEKEKEKAAMAAVEKVWKNAVLPLLEKEMEQDNVVVWYDGISWKSVNCLAFEETTVVARRGKPVNPPIPATITPIIAEGVAHFTISPWGFVELQFSSFLKYSQAADEEEGKVYIDYIHCDLTTITLESLSVATPHVLKIVQRTGIPQPPENISVNVNAIRDLVGFIRKLHSNKLEHTVRTLHHIMLVLRQKVEEALVEDEMFNYISKFSLDFTPTNYVKLWRVLEIHRDGTTVTTNCIDAHYRVNMTAQTRDGRRISINGVSILSAALSGPEDQATSVTFQLRISLNDNDSIQTNLKTLKAEEENIPVDVNEIVTETAVKRVKDALLREMKRKLG